MKLTPDGTLVFAQTNTAQTSFSSSWCPHNDIKSSIFIYAVNHSCNHNQCCTLCALSFHIHPIHENSTYEPYALFAICVDIFISLFLLKCTWNRKPELMQMSENWRHSFSFSRMTSPFLITYLCSSLGVFVPSNVDRAKYIQWGFCLNQMM